ncbi:NADH-quinone oxidoreductase subunit N [bacterium HR11]|nr:NADH-quinone oxidoreductase subunit N [bacterium HR11]
MQTWMTWWTQTQGWALLPAGLFVVLAAVLLVVEAWRPEWLRWLYYGVVLGLIGLIFITFRFLFNQRFVAFGNRLVLDNVTLLTLIMYVVAAAVVVIAMGPVWEAQSERSGSWMGLLLITSVGMLTMSGTSDVLVIFIGLELLSLSLYVLIAYENPTEPALESALKYFLLGAFAAAVFAYGIALMYGAVGSTSLVDLAARLPSLQGTPRGWLAYLGLALMFAGLAFEASAVPFHMWTPDVYQGAPTPTVAYMSAAVKAAAFGAMLRLFGDMAQVFRRTADVWGWGLAGVAVLTMVVGNVLALRQGNVKRLLAYSSIAHAGYILIGLTAAGDAARESVLLYLLAYLFMNMGAFLVVAALEAWGVEPTLERYRSLGYRHPGWALGLTVFLLALAGIPPTAGFVAKLWVFRAAFQAGWPSLVIVGVVTSLIAAYYYFRVVWTMFEPPTADVRRAWKQAPTEPAVPVAGFALAVALCLFFTLQMGVLPNRFVYLVRIAFASF